MREKTYVAKRDRLRVGDGAQVGEIHGGEGYPAADVTPSLLTLGWVSEGRGTVPLDDRTHGAFSEGELGEHTAADPDALKAFQNATAEIEAASTPAAEPTPAPTKSKAKAKKTAKAK